MTRLDDDPRKSDTTAPRSQSIAAILATLAGGTPPMRFSAYDGSVAGPADATIGLHLATPRAAAYLATAPGQLGAVRGYVQGDLEVVGVHPGDPYELLRLFDTEINVRRPTLGQIMTWVRAVGPQALRIPPPPPQEVRPSKLPGRRHSKRRDSTAISHHYDVSNRFYELVLGPSMAYTCACYPDPDATLEEAQEHKFDLVARKLGLRPGMRLLDVGCGWGSMVRHAVTRYGVTALGVTLSREQAAWAQQRIEADGLTGRAEVRHLDYRDVDERDFDAISSIGLIEHIGVRNYPAYFDTLRSKLRVGGRLLNHGITHQDNVSDGVEPGGFIERYVFPDGELTGSGTIVSAMENAGFEVQHQENLRVHYARTLAHWCQNLVEHWDEAVAEAGLATAKIWGLYMAGSRLSFERNGIQLHQVLATRTGSDGTSGYPLRPEFGV